MTDTITIPKDVASRDDRDYNFLREEGLKYIQALAGKMWTDYNAHDPGITFLELLCYAITDLAYRMDLPLENLLADESNSLLSMHRQFHSALKILPTCPATERDYRKLLINIDGVNNAWLKKNESTIFVDYKSQPAKLSYEAWPVDHSQVDQFDLNGLYEILVEIDETVEDKPAVLQAVKETYHRNRNLCEDLVSVSEVSQQPVKVCVEIELEPDARAEKVEADIRFAIENYFSPPVRFYSLPELLEKNIPPDTIFNGPVFGRPVFEKEALLLTLLGVQRWEELLAGEVTLLEELLDDPGILTDSATNLELIKQQIIKNTLLHGFTIDEELDATNLRTDVRTSDLVKEIMKIPGVKLIRDITVGPCGSDAVTGDGWKVCIENGKQPVLCEKSVFKFFKDVLPINVDKNLVAEKLGFLHEERIQSRKAKIVEDLPMPSGQYFKISAFSTIQNDLPDTYGVNSNGLPGQATPLRRVQANQLKAYLLFFDQVLANYFAQLENVGRLLSSDETLAHTYFAQAVAGLKNANSIVKDETNWSENVQNLMSVHDDFGLRRHKLLNHLLARFAEDFNLYVLTMYELFGQQLENLLLRQKADFWKDYPAISAGRGLGMDYYHPSAGIWDSDNISGMERRLSRLGGFYDLKRRDLSGVAIEFYQENDVDSVDEFRWRVRHDSGKILLSSSTHYLDLDALYGEAELAVALAQQPAHFQKEKTEDDTQWYFNIINSDEEIVSRRIEFFDTEAEVDAAIQQVIDFLSGKKLTSEGMFVIEHILLRPDAENAPPELFLPLCMEPDGKFCPPKDPYSYRISVVLPGWTQRFSNLDFRTFFEKIIRSETPAHILPRICWISREEMGEFESLYKAWLEARFSDPDQQAPAPVLNAFIEKLSRLTTVYPSGVLHDCEDEGTAEDDNFLVLGKTNLGNLLKNNES